MTFRLAMLVCLIPLLSPGQAKQVFEVVSVRPSMSMEDRQKLPREQRPPFDSMTISGTRLEMRAFSLRGIVGRAFPNDRDIVVPDWAPSQRFDISAVMPEGAGRAELPEMLRAMLEDRFRLVVHRETAEAQVYLLSGIDGGPRLFPPTEVDVTGCEPVDDQSPTGSKSCSFGGQVGETHVNTLIMIGGSFGGFRQVVTVIPGVDGKTSRIQRTDYFSWAMDDLAASLSTRCPQNRTDCFDLPVVNKTGVTGKWNFRLERSCDSEGCESWSGPLKKIGLKVTKGSAPMDKLVVDQINRTPTEN